MLAAGALGILLFRFFRESPKTVDSSESKVGHTL